MRLLSLALPPLTLFFLACGGTVTDSTGAGEQTGGSASSAESHASASSASSNEGERDAGSPSLDAGEVGSLAGAVYLLTDNESGTWYDSFDTNLQTMTSSQAFCSGAVRTAGSCCYFGPITPPPTQMAGGTSTVAAEPNAGTITLFDVTVGSRISAFAYSGGVYATLPMNYTGQPWQPGDVLRVTASGGSTIGAFSLDAPAVAPPRVVMPSTLSTTEDLALTWEPDPNADTWTFSILDGETGAEVACSSPEAAGAITVDASLLADFTTGSRDQVVATATTIRYADAPQGRIQLQSAGWAGLPYVTFE